ncbi:hypothetical protein SEA_WELCOME_107 [Microbacterium phage Welcome]|nr:hypothetical protein SEA_WELCOME_107 [Microbacterium phage Welcome]
MILNTRIEFNNLSTRARFDKVRGYFFIKGGDTAPSVGDTIAHEGEGYDVISVGSLDAAAGTRSIQVRLLDDQNADSNRKPEPLADWERELLYGTTGPMPTRDIIKSVLQRSAGKGVLAQLGANSDRHLRSLLGHAVVLAKQEMAEYQKRQQAVQAKEQESSVPKAAVMRLGSAAISELSKAFATGAAAVAEAEAKRGALPLVPETRERPSIADTLEAVSYYVDNDAWEGRFERMVRSIRKPIRFPRPLASGGYVHGGPVPVGTSLHSTPGNGMN